jgi:peptide/nickel transport system ATP-binding protein
LLDDPKHPYTHALLQGTSDPDADNALTYKEVPPGEPPSLVNPPQGCHFHPRCAQCIKGICDMNEPPEFEPAPGHLVSCWLFEK